MQVSISQSVSWKTQSWHLFLNIKKMRPRDNYMACQWCEDSVFTATEPVSDYVCLPMPPSSAHGTWYKEQRQRASSQAEGLGVDRQVCWSLSHWHQGCELR